MRIEEEDTDVLAGEHPSFVPAHPQSAIRDPKSGFTLVELLVVIAIIMLLAALLLPALKRAQDKAYAAVCAGNLRQNYITTVMYAGDFQGYPPYWNGLDSSDCCVIWSSACSPGLFAGPGLEYQAGYLGPTTTNGHSGQVGPYYCPKLVADVKYHPNAFYRDPFLWGVTGWNLGGGSGGRINYAYSYRYAMGAGNSLNFTVGGQYFGFSPKPDPYLPRLETGGSVVALYHCDMYSYRDAAATSPAAHGDGTESLYCDGHVKWVKVDLADPPPFYWWSDVLDEK